MFDKSLDGGQTFAGPVQVSDGWYFTINPSPSVGPDGELYVTWWDWGTKISFDRSVDGGQTWLRKDILIEGNLRRPQSIVIAEGPPISAVDRSYGPYRGRLYVVYTDVRFGSPDILLRYSVDRGDTWSEPVRVNDDAPGNGAEQGLASIAIDGNGHVQVQFLDRRADPGPEVRVAVTLATSTNGGVSFGPNIRVSDEDKKRLAKWSQSASLDGEETQDGGA